jgi:hypothetical protein
VRRTDTATQRIAADLKAVDRDRRHFAASKLHFDIGLCIGKRLAGR